VQAPAGGMLALRVHAGRAGAVQTTLQLQA